MPKTKILPIVLLAAIFAAAQQAQQSSDIGQQIWDLANRIGSAFIGAVLGGIESAWYWITAALFYLGIVEIIFVIFIYRRNWTLTVPGLIFLAIAMGVPVGIALIGQAAGLPPDVLDILKCKWSGYLFHGMFCGGGGAPGTGSTITGIG